MVVVRKTIIAALLALAGCVEEQERHAPIGSAPAGAGVDREQEHQKQCGIDHDNCVEWCEGKPESERYHCIFTICAEALEECRGDE